MSYPGYDGRPEVYQPEASASALMIRGFVEPTKLPGYMSQAHDLPQQGTSAGREWSIGTTPSTMSSDQEENYRNLSFSEVNDMLVLALQLLIFVGRIRPGGAAR